MYVFFDKTNFILVFYAVLVYRRPEAQKLG